MRKYISLSIITAIALVSFSGCAAKYTPVDSKASGIGESHELYQANNTESLGNRAIQEILINGQLFEDDSANIPKGPIIETLQLDGVKLRDAVRTISMLSGANIALQNSQDPTKQDQTSTTTTSSTSTSDKDFMSEKKIFLSVNNIAVLDALKVAIGNELGISYENGTYILGKRVTTTFNIPPIDIVQKDSSFGATETTKLNNNNQQSTQQTDTNGLVDTIKSMGGTNVIFNKMASKITFTTTADKTKQIKIFLKEYVENLVLIDFEVAIYEVILNKLDRNGINWNKLGRFPTVGGSFGLAGGSAVAGNSFTLSGAGSDNGWVADGVLSFLKTNYNLSTISKPSLKLLNGSKAELNIGLQEEFAKEIGRVTASTSGTATTTTTFEKVLSGIGLALQGTYFNDTVVGSLSGNLSSIPSYDSLTIDGNTYKKPKINTKSFASNFRLKPGDTIVISGLMERKNSKKVEGVPGVSDTPLENIAGYVEGDVINTEVVIMLTPKVTKFVFSKKSEINPIVKTEAILVKEEVKPVAKTEVKPVAKEEVKPVAKEEVKPVIKEEVKPVVKEDVKPVVKEDVKPVAKEEVKPVAKEEVKPVAKEEVKPVEKKTVCEVIKDNVNIRSCPNTGCEISTIAMKGSTYLCGESVNGWTEVGNKFYVNTDLIKKGK